MRVSTTFAAVLTAILTDAAYAAQAWPYNLPRDVKYFPEDETHIKRELQSQEQMAIQNPAQVKKMSEDEGEKFFLHYWGFDEVWTNSSMAVMSPAIARHANHDRLDSFSLLGRGLFARDYKCPDKTNACSNLDSPLCCPDGQSCVRVNNGVGCCPSGSNCGGSIGSCDTGAGYKSCPGSEGGCCIPGAECKDSGCVFYGTSTTIATASPATTSTSSSPPSGSTQTVTVTTTIGGQATTTTVVISAISSCSSGFQTCASSLGGGCCPTDRVCGTSNSCLTSSTSSSASASAPIRPTSVTDSTITGAAVPTTSTSGGFCPTGFYMCEAVYLGGCCRVGRDCQTTSCPSTASTQVESSGATIVVPVSVSQGICPNGWAACGSSEGGGCCPSNYVCGTQSCTATVSGQQNTAKMAPSAAGVASAVGWGFLVLGLGAAMGMVVL